MNKIVIIGGGFSGTMLAVHLIKHSTRPVSIAIVEKRSQLGEGVAYSTTNQHHLLNVRAKGMSALPDQPLHFWEFVKARYLQYTEDSFVPRSIYGDYLKHILDEALAESKLKGISVETINGEAVNLKQSHGRYQIDFADGRFVLAADYVVLAVGNLARERFDVFSVLGSDYVSDPLSEGALNSIEPTDDVLVLGTGLTSIDKMVQLLKRGHRGKVIALSRHGLLPNKHSFKSKPIDLSSRTDSIPKTARETLRFVRQLISETSDWRDAIDSLRPFSQLWWQKLNSAEQSRFKRHLQTLWDVHRHRMAPSVAEIIEFAVSSGQLQVIRGRAVAARKNESTIIVSVRERSSHQTNDLLVNKIIDCTGFSFDLSKLDSALLKNMHNTGLLSAHPSGEGVEIDEHVRLINFLGKPNKRLFLLGPILRTQLFENTAVPELRVQALELAQAVLSRIRFQQLQQQALPSEDSTIPLYKHTRSSSTVGTS